MLGKYYTHRLVLSARFNWWPRRMRAGLREVVTHVCAWEKLGEVVPDLKYRPKELELNPYILKCNVM